jgi:hypothetical protein
LQNNREVTASSFLSKTANSTARVPSEASFRNLFTECKFGDAAAYMGSAEGYVMLKDGKKVNVTGNSGKYEVANCSIGAQ